ncbi:MAG: glycosyltransferase family 4 protein [Ginsengibacter sp.]
MSSRANKKLLENLLKNDFPILLEGIHCTYYLFNDALKNRRVTVRLHNVEYEYYKQLAKSAKNLFKKLYFLRESKLLESYEKSIANKAGFLTVSEKDKITYEKRMQAEDVKFLPVFLPFNKISSETGNGSFCLYHGNLSVSENEKAVLWLLDNVFNVVSIPFVIAGKNPSKRLEHIVHQNKNTCLISNPSVAEMNDLIQKAHIHILPSFNNTGVKIKLLNALFMGRFVITNDNAIEGTGLDHLCKIANTPGEYQTALPKLFEQAFTENEILAREKTLLSLYNNKTNAHQLMQWIC